MEDDYLARTAADEEARRLTYKEEVASAKLATVSQIVSGQVVIRPPGSNSPGRSRSPGTCYTHVFVLTAAGSAAAEHGWGCSVRLQVRSCRVRNNVGCNCFE